VTTPQVRRLFGLLELDRLLDIKPARPDIDPLPTRAAGSHDHPSRAKHDLTR
jgi:hypothetical protein